MSPARALTILVLTVLGIFLLGAAAAVSDYQPRPIPTYPVGQPNATPVALTEVAVPTMRPFVPVNTGPENKFWLRCMPWGRLSEKGCPGDDIHDESSTARPPAGGQ